MNNKILELILVNDELLYQSTTILNETDFQRHLVSLLTSFYLKNKIPEYEQIYHGDLNFNLIQKTLKEMWC